MCGQHLKAGLTQISTDCLREKISRCTTTISQTVKKRQGPTQMQKQRQITVPCTDKWLAQHNASKTVRQKVHVQRTRHSLTANKAMDTKAQQSETPLSGCTKPRCTEKCLMQTSKQCQTLERNSPLKNEFPFKCNFNPQ